MYNTNCNIMKMKYVLGIGLLITLCLLMGCIQEVKHTLISPEIKNIPSWSLGIEQKTLDDSSSESISMLNKDFESEYSRLENKIDYCESIAKILSKKGHNIVTDGNAIGTIKIKIVADKSFYTLKNESKYITSRFPTKETESMKEPEQRIPNINEIIILPKNKPSEKIIGVQFSFLDYNKNLLGIVQIRDEDIKLKEVTKVLDRIFKKGKYNNSKGLSKSLIFRD